MVAAQVMGNHVAVTVGKYFCYHVNDQDTKQIPNCQYENYRRKQRPFRIERLQAVDRVERVAIDPLAGRQQQRFHQELRRRHRSQSRSHQQTAARIAHAGDGPQPAHRLRQGLPFNSNIRRVCLQFH